MDNLETEERNNKGQYSNDYDANGDAHGVSRHRREDLTDNDIINDSVATANNDIQERCKISAVVAKRITRRSDLAEAELQRSQNISNA